MTRSSVKKTAETSGGDTLSVCASSVSRQPVSWSRHRIHPLEEAGGDPERMRELTFHDVVQCVSVSRPAVVCHCKPSEGVLPFTPHRSILRVGEEGGVYCSPPEKWGVRAIPVVSLRRLSC